MAADIEKIYNTLFTYCKDRGFAGFDPFDGLNSRFFQATPLKRSRLIRLAWLQMIKRSPFDLRSILKVNEGVNAKGLALFALAEFSRFRATADHRHQENASRLMGRMLELGVRTRTSDRRRVLGFGYNFDWQSRNFFAPRGTPAIVPTAFAGHAIAEAIGLLGTDKYLRDAAAICEFILTRLNRPVETADEVCFSYTPYDNQVIYNASLLAGECLALGGFYLGNAEYSEEAAKTVRFAIRQQRHDGAWVYGRGPKQQWVDSFHTAYVLLSLHRISALISGLRDLTREPIRRGASYWLDNFFLADGTPKYYDNSVYPIDVHSAASAMVAMTELRHVDERMMPIAHRVLYWTINNMLSDEGYFYYRITRRSTVKTPFMRWGQAWMAYCLALFLESTNPDPPVLTARQLGPLCLIDDAVPEEKT